MDSRLLSRLDGRRPAGSRSGFTLIEVLIASLVILLAMMSAVGTLTQVTVLGEANRESTIAYQAARAMLEQVQATPFNDVFERFNADPNDDPDGAGTAEGMNFAVPELNLQAGDADGFCGRILWPVSAGNTLRENLNDATFGMPMDLNGDSFIDASDHVDDMVVLPVRVQVQWNGKSGNRTAEFATILGRRL